MNGTGTSGDTTPPPPLPRLYLRPDEAASAIGISRRTLSEWQARHIIPFLRVRGVVLFAVADILEALDRFKFAPVGEPSPRRMYRMKRIPQQAAQS